MADEKAKPAPAAANEGPKGLNDLKTDPVAQRQQDEGTLRADGGGTVQYEPRAEDYPAQARVTPPAEQINPALSQVVGQASDTNLGAQIGEAAEAAQASIDEAISATDKRFEQERKAKVQETLTR